MLVSQTKRIQRTDLVACVTGEAYSAHRLTEEGKATAHVESEDTQTTRCERRQLPGEVPTSGWRPAGRHGGLARAEAGAADRRQESDDPVVEELPQRAVRSAALLLQGQTG